ncbi:MAG: Flp pilus assembly complex ATPase component TadA [Deltaproteobacteria bacterium]|nr:Flp pilus assembly complex ATPase component TadA [Deltaproteobacteria bacterium]
MEVDVIIEGEEGDSWTERVSTDGPITIGRHYQSSVCLDSDLISRQHVIFHPTVQGLIVEDVSTNGTLAGGILLRKSSMEIAYGTPVVVGEYTLRLQPAGQVEVRPPTAPPRAYKGDMPTERVMVSDPSVQAVRMAHAKRLADAHAAPVPGPPPRAVPAPLPGAAPAAMPIPGPPPRPVPGPPPRAIPGPAPAAQPPTLAPAPAPVDSAPQQEDRPSGEIDADVALRREIHRQLLEHLDLATLDPSKLDDPSMRPKVLGALRRIVKLMDARIPAGIDRDKLVGDLADEALGLGPLERFLSDPTISEVMVVDPNTIFVERGGKLVLTEARFTDDERVRAVIERIVTPLGRRIDESAPLVDARLKDGSRVNAVIRPIALRGSCITIRKFSRVPLTVEKLIGYGTLTESMARFLSRSVIAKKNIVISGGTGSGKTTLLNVLSSAIPEEERIVTIEDAAELQLHQPHVVSLETRPANMEGKGEYTIRDLVRNALRMRPDRIVVGECRGGEALDMLQAMNTGHEGSMTTTHANSPEEGVARIETLALMSGVDLPSRAIRDQIAKSIHLVVQQSRFPDGTRKITAITELVGIDEADGSIELRPIYLYVRTGTGEGGKVLGEFQATGYLPSFLDDFIVTGLIKPGEPFL